MYIPETEAVLYWSFEDPFLLLCLHKTNLSRPIDSVHFIKGTNGAIAVNAKQKITNRDIATLFGSAAVADSIHDDGNTVSTIATIDSMACYTFCFFEYGDLLQLFPTEFERLNGQ